ncbi:MAG: endonuclease III [Desulfurivibrio sp.]|nr:endonuclease III [Desulfurivibrio sp.]
MAIPKENDREFAIDEALARLAAAVPGYRVPVVDLIAVQGRDPYRILLATILSSRTRDETTATAAARLFAQAPDLRALARLSPEQLAALIHPVGFYRTKARHLARLPAVLEQLFGGVIPDRVEELIKLPGVGRKTANLVVALAFQQPAICVDTHVHRLMNLWGYVATKDPEATEKALRAKLPRHYWLTLNSTLVAFGQEICRPRQPRCSRCPVADLCPGGG